MQETKPPRWTPYAVQSQSGPESIGALLMTDAETHRRGAPALLHGLNDREVADVVAAGKQKVVYRGAALFKQGAKHDGIYLIESGRIKVFYTAPSGREITLAYWHPGNFVGGPEVFDTGIHVWSGVAAVNSSVLHLSGETLRRMIAKIPALGISVIEGLAFKGKCYSGLAQMLGTRSATERLAHLLLHLSALYGVDEHDGILIAASFTHADIANMIGATRQWVTISLKRHTDAGVVRTHHSNLVVVKPDVLVATRDGRTKQSD